MGEIFSGVIAGREAFTVISVSRAGGREMPFWFLYCQRKSQDLLL